MKVAVGGAGVSVSVGVLVGVIDGVIVGVTVGVMVGVSIIVGDGDGVEVELTIGGVLVANGGGMAGVKPPTLPTRGVRVRVGVAVGIGTDGKTMGTDVVGTTGIGDGVPVSRYVGVLVGSGVRDGWVVGLSRVKIVNVTPGVSVGVTVCVGDAV